MNETMNDLSFDQTKLDYQAMLTTAEVAHSRCLGEIYRDYQELTRFPLTGCFYLSAQRLAVEAKYLVTISETLHTLREGLTRHELEVVNKPEVVD